MRLNIGGIDPDGNKTGPSGDDWIVVDRKTGGEAYPLEYEDGCADEVYASHILEHFTEAQVKDVLREWVRVLKPGGRLRVAVPDQEWAAKEILSGNPHPFTHQVIYGSQVDDNDFHRTGFNENALGYSLLSAGLVGVKTWESPYKDCSGLPCSLNMEGFKPAGDLFKPNGHLNRRFRICKSVPRLCFSHTVSCMERVHMQLGGEAESQVGAFWEQRLSECIRGAVESDVEWVVTTDYDTLFNADHFLQMACIFDAHPEIDALAALQLKRGGKQILFGQIEGDEKQLDQEVCRVKTAHFGLTFFRAEAFGRMPKPWFIGTPNEDGDWAEGRRDPDMAFWDQWRACGNTLAITPWVPVGHIIEDAIWPSASFGVVHQDPSDFFREGAPKGARTAQWH